MRARLADSWLESCGLGQTQTIILEDPFQIKWKIHWLKNQINCNISATSILLRCSSEKVNFRFFLRGWRRVCVCQGVQKRDKQCTWNAFIKICRSLIDVLHFFFLTVKQQCNFSFLVFESNRYTGSVIKGITRLSSANSPAFLLITAKKYDLKLKILKHKYFCSIKELAKTITTPY